MKKTMSILFFMSLFAFGIYAQSIVIEVTTFNLNGGVDPDVFEARDAEILDDFTSLQPGYLKRMSGATSDGKYLVMVFWETLADADASITAFQSDPTVGDYFAMIDGNTFSAERYTSLTLPDINFSLEGNNVIEVGTFNINNGIDPAEFETRDAEIDVEFSSQQPGYIRRTSGVDANGKYAMIVFWETLADADASIAAFQSDPSVADYFAMIDGNTFVLERFSLFNGTSSDEPLAEGLDITLRNTLQNPGENEGTYASLFGSPDDAFDEFATLSNSEIEFATALAQNSATTGLPFDINGLYEIDFTENSIEFTLLPDETDPFWIQQFGVFPAGKFDRYYFTLPESHTITSWSSNNNSVDLRIDSDNVIVVELSEGYDFNPGISFIISLNPPPLSEGLDITLRNTLQNPGENEGTYASLFGSPDDAFDEFATLSNSEIEFATALAQNSTTTGLPFDINGLYEIDFTENSIEFTLLPDETDPFWIQQFGVFPAGKFDRYYFTLPESHNITSWSSNNNSVDLRIDSDNVIVVELSEGYDFNPGLSFIISLNPPPPLAEEVDVILRNTLQDPGEDEVTYASLFGSPDDAFDEFAILSNSEIEFATALAQTGTPVGDINGLYEIDLTESSIEFTALPDANDPFWTNVFGLFPEGKFDRYYFTFSEPHNITSAASNHTSVNVRVDSDHVIVVEISEGYDLKPGAGFFISLNMAEELTNEQKARGFNEGLQTGDPSALNWMRNDYIQHNLTVPTGKEGVAFFYTGQPIGLTIDINRSFEAGDYVFAQTTFGGSWGDISGAGTDQIIYDVWRFEDGFAVEHWDNIGDVVDDMDGTTQTDGVVTPVTNLDQTNTNQALLEAMAQTLFVEGDWTNVRDYFDIDNYVQHSVGAGTDGAFLASLEGQTGVPFYEAVKFVHTSGNFGLVMSQGPDITGQDPNGVYAYYDLFRIENGLIVEHWDIIEKIPPVEEWVNTNGKWGDDAIIGVDLNLSLEVSNLLYDQYSNVDYIFTVTNEGDKTATNIEVDMPLPNGLVYSSHSTSNSDFSLFFENWTIPTLAPGESIALNLSLFTLIDDQDITYYAQVNAVDQSDADSSPGNDTDQTPDEDDEAAVTIKDSSEGGYGGGDGTADLELEVSVANATYDNWEHIFFTITLTNNGPDAATGIVVNTPEPEVNSKFAGSNPANISNGDWSEWAEEWTIDELASGATATLTLDIFTLGEEDPITLFSQVFIANEFDSDSTPGNNTNQIPNEDDENSATIDFLNLDFTGGNSGSAQTNGADTNAFEIINLSMFPNPVTDYITLAGQVETTQTGSIQIMNIEGKVLKNFPIDFAKGYNELTLEVSDLQNGVYILQIHGNEGVIENKRFIKLD